MPRAIWNGTIIAESDDTLVVEGNHYFPRESVAERYIRESSRRTSCSWKGTASYLTIEVDGEREDDAAWYYPDPLPAAERIRGRVAFWGGVRVED